MTVKCLCDRVGISRQAYYKERKVRQRKEIERVVIVDLVKEERRIQPKIGTRKLMRMLENELAKIGISIGRDRFFDLLRERNLLIEKKAKFAKTTDSQHGFYAYPNLIRNICPSMPNQLWVSDLTYISTDEGFMYLALITDVFSRKIVGFDISDSLEAEGCMRALKMALRQLLPGERPIHHSDRGTQYCSKAYVGLLKKHGCIISMTEVNHCYENALAERVNGILKDEYYLNQTFRNKTQAINAVRQAIRIYNDRRLHTGLNYRTPSSVHAEGKANRSYSSRNINEYEGNTLKNHQQEKGLDQPIEPKLQDQASSPDLACAVIN